MTEYVVDHRSQMKPINLQRLVQQNSAYRDVVNTTQQTQIVIMSIAPGSDIPEETHLYSTQIITCEAGIGEAVLNGKTSWLRAGYTIVIPAGTLHRIVNISDVPLKISTIYAPPTHPPNTYQETRPEHDYE